MEADLEEEASRLDFAAPGDLPYAQRFAHNVIERLDDAVEDVVGRVRGMVEVLHAQLTDTCHRVFLLGHRIDENALRLNYVLDQSATFVVDHYAQRRQYRTEMGQILESSA